MSTMNIFDLTDTWNDVATTFTAIKMNATDTASSAGSLLLDLQVGGASKFSITKAASITVNRNAATLPTLLTAPTLYSAGVDGSANDFVYLAGAQINRLLFIRANSTVAAPATLASGDTVGQINGGGYNGAAYVTNAVRVQWRANEAWTSTASGTRLEIVTTPNTTNSPANVATFYGGGVHIGNTPTDPGAGALSTQGSVKAASLTEIPAGGTAGAGLMVSSTANFGVFFGSGAPTLSAAKGSLYMRSDGSGINDRMYVNTDGATTWTAVVTTA
jgi:hypothetical protein